MKKRWSVMAARRGSMDPESRVVPFPSCNTNPNNVSVIHQAVAACRQGWLSKRESNGVNGVAAFQLHPRLENGFFWLTTQARLRRRRGLAGDVEGCGMYFRQGKPASKCTQE